MISLVRLGDRRRDGFKRGEDGQFLALGVPNQHFVEESEALDRRREPRFAACRVERRSVNPVHVASEGIVDRRHCIKWFCHDSSLLVPPPADLYDMRIMPYKRMRCQMAGESSLILAMLLFSNR